MTILVCGGRDYEDRARMIAVLKEHRHGHQVLIHGSARGADRLAASVGVELGFIVNAYPAMWERDGRAAGPIRNQLMLDDGKPDLVIAFPGGKGTADMLRRAKKAGVPTLEVRP